MVTKMKIFFGLGIFIIVLIQNFKTATAENFKREAERDKPSFRLRFGRSLNQFTENLPTEKRWFGEVNQKPIRSPSLRLRFGKRDGQMLPIFNRNAYLFNELIPYIGNNEYQRINRKPSTRLRWGRNGKNLEQNKNNEDYFKYLLILLNELNDDENTDFDSSDDILDESILSDKQNWLTPQDNLRLMKNQNPGLNSGK